jgi:hypothetical protein
MEAEQFSDGNKAEVTLKRDDPVANYSMKLNNNIGRYALSKNICRFELPIDMKLFESKALI